MLFIKFLNIKSREGNYFKIQNLKKKKKSI
jgi:hypothetical protein